MSKTVTVPLETPLMLGSEEIRELTFRTPRAGDMRGTNITITEGGLRFDIGAILDLAAKLSNTPPSLINQAELGDVMRIVEAVAPLLPSSLTAGS